jgi:signal transduction histidine kinase
MQASIVRLRVELGRPDPHRGHLERRQVDQPARHPDPARWRRHAVGRHHDQHHRQQAGAGRDPRSRARLAELTEHIEQVKEQERTRIAREIHDDLGGNLTAIKMALAMLAARLPPEPALQEKADYLDSLVDRTIEAVHRISLDLRPSMLDLGIVAALEWQAREFEKQMGIACVFRADGDDIDDIEGELDPDHASALFRIFQESLTNIAKHAGATRVTVTLRRQRQHLTLTICDNGRGITPADRLKPQSFGLRGMSERAGAGRHPDLVAGARRWHDGDRQDQAGRLRRPRQPETTRA